MLWPNDKSVRLEILPAGETENAKLQLQRRLEGVKTTAETLKFGVLAVPRINWNCDSYEVLYEILPCIMASHLFS